MIVIKIYNNNWEEIDLYKDSSISFQYNSSIFNFEKIAGDYSLPFKVPASINNKRIFNYPNRLSNISQSEKKLDCEIYMNGLLLHIAIISVTQTDNSNFHCNIKFNVSDFSAKYKDKMLHEQDLGGEQDWVWRNDYNPENSDFALPEIYNPDFFLNSSIESYPAKKYIINIYDADEEKYVLETIIDNTSSIIIPIVPFPYLFKILNYLFQELGYTVDNYFESTDELKKLLIYNTKNIVKYTQKTVPRLAWEQIITKIKLNEHVPVITIKKFILSLKKYFCLDFSFKNNHLKIIPIKNYLINNSFINISDKELLDEKKNFQSKKNGFEIQFETDSDNYQINEDVRKLIKKNFSDEVLTIPASPEIGDIIHLIEDPNFKELGSFIQYKYVETNGYYYYSWVNINSAKKDHNYFSEIKPELIFNTNISYLNQESYDEGVPIKFRRSISVRQQGNSQFHGLFQEFNLKLCFQGYNEGISVYYPTASSIGDSFSIDFWGLKSVTRIYWKEFTDWYLSIPYKLNKKIKFSLSEIKHFDFSRKYLIDNQLFFIESFKVTMKVNGDIGLCDCILLPAPD